MGWGKFETWARKLRASWASGPAGNALLGALGYVLGDIPLQEGQAVLLEQIPSTATDTASLALELVERQIIPSPSLGTSDLQALAAAAPNLNRLRGTSIGICIALHYAGFPKAIVISQNGKAYQITGTPALSDLQGLADLSTWSPPAWFTITTLSNRNPPIPASADGKAAIAYATVPWWTLGAPMDSVGNQFANRLSVLFWIPGDGADPGLSDATALARCWKVINAWKPVDGFCEGIHVCTSGRFVGWPVRKVNDGGNVGPGAVTHYTP